MKNKKIYMKYIVKTVLVLIITAQIFTGTTYADNNQPQKPVQTPDIIKNTLNLIPTVQIGDTEQQLEIIRSFLVNTVNTIPGLNLTQQQQNSILSYFDLNPSVFTVMLTPRQTEAIYNGIINNYGQIASLKLSEQDLNSVITIINNNSINISNLININPEIASLIKRLAPQINNLAAANQQIRSIVSVLKTNVPEINTLLSL